MKITGPAQIPGQSPAAEASPLEGKEQIAGTDSAGAPEGASGASFAERVAGARSEGVGGAAPPAAPGIADISREVSAGKLSPQSAAERVLERVLDRQLDPSAPVAVREQVRAALREALETDPLLADAMRQLR